MRVQDFKGVGGILLSTLLIASTLIVFNSSAAAADPAPVSAETTSSGSDEVSSASGSNRFIVWRDFSPGNAEILLRRSTDDGATWGSKINLSKNGGPSSDPAIAVSGSNVYVAWIDKTPGNYEILFKRSTDNGATWKPTINLSNTPGPSLVPLVAAIGSHVYVVWEQQNAAGTANDIFFRRSTDNGATWKFRVNLSNDGFSVKPLIAATDSKIYVSWVLFNAPCFQGPADIFFRRSIDNGASWEAKVNLSKDSCELSDNHSMSYAGSSVYVAWDEIATSGHEVYFARSVNSGASWKDPVNLSQDGTSGSLFPTIASSGSNVYLAWADGEADGNLAFKRSLDNGATWKAKIYLTQFDLVSNPRLAATGSLVYLIWEDYTPGSADVVFRRSLDAGATWKSKVNLSVTGGDSLNSVIALKGTTVFVLWQDHTTANPEVYVKRSTDNGATWKAKVNLSSNSYISDSARIGV